MGHFVGSCVKLLCGLVIAQTQRFTDLNRKATACCECWTWEFVLEHSQSPCMNCCTVQKTFKLSLSSHSLLLSSWWHTRRRVNLLVSRLHRAVYAVSSLLRVGSPGTRGGVYWTLKQNKMKICHATITKHRNITFNILRGVELSHKTWTGWIIFVWVEVFGKMIAKTTSFEP